MPAGVMRALPCDHIPGSQDSRLAGSQPDPASAGRHGAVAGGESGLPGKRLQFGRRAPRFPSVVGHQQAKPHMISTSGSLHRITVEDALLPVEEENSIPEAGRIGVGQEQLPAGTAIRRLIEPGLVARSARQQPARFARPRPRCRGSPACLLRVAWHTAARGSRRPRCAVPFRPCRWPKPRHRPRHGFLADRRWTR